MAVETIGPAVLDPFSLTPDRAPEEPREPDQEVQAQVKAEEQAPLPEGLGTKIDTSA